MLTSCSASFLCLSVFSLTFPALICSTSFTRPYPCRGGHPHLLLLRGATHPAVQLRRVVHHIPQRCGPGGCGVPEHKPGAAGPPQLPGSPGEVFQVDGRPGSESRPGSSQAAGWRDGTCLGQHDLPPAVGKHWRTAWSWRYRNRKWEKSFTKNSFFAVAYCKRLSLIGRNSYFLHRSETPEVGYVTLSGSVEWWLATCSLLALSFEENTVHNISHLEW